MTSKGKEEEQLPGQGRHGKIRFGLIPFRSRCPGSHRIAVSMINCYLFSARAGNDCCAGKWESQAKRSCGRGEGGRNTLEPAEMRS